MPISETSAFVRELSRGRRITRSLNKASHGKIVGKGRVRLAVSKSPMMTSALRKRHRQRSHYSISSCRFDDYLHVISETKQAIHELGFAHAAKLSAQDVREFWLCYADDVCCFALSKLASRNDTPYAFRELRFCEHRLGLGDANISVNIAGALGDFHWLVFRVTQHKFQTITYQFHVGFRRLVSLG